MKLSNALSEMMGLFGFVNIKEGWAKIKRVLEVGQASTIYCSIATVNPDGTPYITPVGTVFLRDDQTGYFLITTQRAWALISIIIRTCALWR